MPVIAKSPPMSYGSKKPAPPPYNQPSQPSSAGTSPGSTVYNPPTESESCNANKILTDHENFIKKVDSIGACFKRKAIPEFSDKDFKLHIELAKADKYIVQSGDMFCSMQAIDNLSKKLNRSKDI